MPEQRSRGASVCSNPQTHNVCAMGNAKAGWGDGGMGRRRDGTRAVSTGEARKTFSRKEPPRSVKSGKEPLLPDPYMDSHAQRPPTRLIHKLGRSGEGRTGNSTPTRTHMHTCTHRLGGERNSSVFQACCSFSQAAQPTVPHTKSGYQHLTNSLPVFGPLRGEMDWKLPGGHCKTAAES